MRPTSTHIPKIRSKRRYYTSVLEGRGMRSARADRSRTARRVIRLSSNSHDARLARSEWVADPSRFDLAGIDTRSGGRKRKRRRGDRTFMAYQRRFQTHGTKEGRRVDRQRRARRTTRVKLNTPRAIVIKEMWIANPGSADLVGIDTPRRRSMGRRRSGSF